MRKGKTIDEQTKSVELLAMERLLRNESSMDVNKNVKSEIEGRTIMKKDMKKLFKLIEEIKDGKEIKINIEYTS